MPELPEVEICCRMLSRRLTGATVLDAKSCDPKIRLHGDLIGRRITAIRRRAKYLRVALSGEGVLLVHLGMTGWFEFSPPARHRFVLKTDRAVAYFEDARRFGRVQLLTTSEAERALDRLGPEPLEAGFNLEQLSRTSRCVKVALLDQRLVAGIGNIYASESLWRARIHPMRQADALTKSERERLRRGIVASLKKAIGYGARIFTAPGQFHVYGREGRPCHRCRAPLQRIVQVGRSSYFCPECQT